MRFLRGAVFRQSIGASDEPDDAIVSPVKEAPVHEYQSRVGELYQIHEVNEEPGQPSEQARDMERTNLSDGGSAADYRQVPFIEITERRRRLAGETQADKLGNITALLHGDLRN